MIKKHSLLLTLLLTGSVSMGQYKGRVFVDSNQNQKREQSEAGIPAVVISDGYELVKTAADGSFSLPHHKNARFLFVRIPSGYKAVGSHYLKIDNKLDSYDFGLVKDEKQQQDRIRFIQITDTETPLYGEWIDNIRNYSQLHNVGLLMHTGDICYELGMQFHARQVNSDLMQLPTYYAVGNHDLVKGEYGEKLFEDLFGPVYYSFEAGPAHFVVTPMPGGDYAPSYTQDQVIAWLKKDLALKDKNKPLIFINHDLLGGKDFILKGKTDSIDLKQYNLKGYLYGHWHNNYSFARDNGVAVISTNAPNKGGIDNSVGQFMVIDVDKNGVNRITPIYPNLRRHAELVYPNGSNVLMTRQNKVEINANVYDSEKKITEVYARLISAKGQVVETVSLKAHSDWNWRGIFSKKITEDEKYEVILEICYGDDSKFLKNATFTMDNYGKENSLKLSWSTNIGTNIWKSSPLMVGERLFIAGIDDAIGGKSKIQAMDAKSGKLIWSIPTKNSVKQKLAYSEGLILATDMGGTVYAIDANTGKLRWTKELSGGRLPGYVSAGTIKDGVYYTGAGNYLSALKVADGTMLWQNKDWNGGEGMPGELLATADQLVTGANWYSLFVHDINTGKLIWKKDEDGLRFRTGGASVSSEILYVAGLEHIFKLDEKSGALLKKSAAKDDFKVMASPLVLDDLVVMPTAANGIKAYDKGTLEEKWHFKTSEALIYTSAYSTPDQHKPVRTVEAAPRLIDGKLYFGASDGYLYILNIDGTLHEKINLGAPLLAEVSHTGRQLYVADFAGNIYSFTLSKSNG